MFEGTSDVKWEGGEMDFDDAVDDWYDESIIWYYSRRLRRVVRRSRKSRG